MTFRNKLPRIHKLSFLLLIAIFLVIYNLLQTWNHFQKRKLIIKTAKEKLERITSEQNELKRKLAQVESGWFIEEQARNKLNMGKEGETVVILPPITPIQEIIPTPTVIVQNWQKWLQVFY